MAVFCVTRRLCIAADTLRSSRLESSHISLQPSQKLCVHRLYIENRQYSKEEYEQLVPKIIEHMTSTGEWGEFFPKNYTPYGYNETSAQEIFPMTREQVLALGYQWQDDLPMITGKQTLVTDQLPASGAQIDVESLTGQVLPCADCGRNYKLIPQELVFYAQLKVPVPTKCPTCRHHDRLARKLPLQLWERVCQCEVSGHESHHGQISCSNQFQTAYAPDRPETVYCQECYHAEYVS